MLALPFITERTEFSGVVYATEPTVNFGKSYMEEVVKYIERVPKIKQAKLWKNLAVFKQLPFLYGLDNYHNGKPNTWQGIYTLKEVNSSLSKIKVVGFAEKVVSKHFACNLIIEATKIIEDNTLGQTLYEKK